MYGERATPDARRRSRAPLVIAIVAAAAAVGVTAWLWRPTRAPLGAGPAPAVELTDLGDRLVVRVHGAAAVWLYRDAALVARCPDDTAPEADGCALDAGQRVLTSPRAAAGRYTVLVVASLRPSPPTLDAAVAELTRDGVRFTRRDLR